MKNIKARFLPKEEIRSCYTYHVSLLPNGYIRIKAPKVPEKQIPYNEGKVFVDRKGNLYEFVQEEKLPATVYFNGKIVVYCADDVFFYLGENQKVYMKAVYTTFENGAKKIYEEDLLKITVSAQEQLDLYEAKGKVYVIRGDCKKGYMAYDMERETEVARNNYLRAMHNYLLNKK